MIFYDFEVFAHDWMVVFIDPYNEQETVIVNDTKVFQEFYNENKDEVWIGFNSRNYDQWIAKSILAGFNPKEMNDWIILKGLKGHDFSDLLKRFPVLNFDIMTGFNGLKTLEAFMGNDIRESSVPFDIDRKLTASEIAETIEYCRHDVEQTMEVFARRLNEFVSQLALINTFKLPLSQIGKTQAQLSAVILGAKRVDLNDGWDIRLPDTLQLDKYRYVADWFLDKRNHNDDAWLETEVCGVPHTFAWGGVHGAIPKYQFECATDEIMVMADVDQLYPTLMVEYGLLSRAVKEPEKFKVILDTSLRLKAEKKKKEREPYKRICNITYGTMGDRFNPMFDELHRKLVCVFGQILLLDLIEKIEPFCELIQSNTDGILIKIKRKDFDRLDDAVYEWEQRTRLHMSFDYFEKIYQKDVNNYIAVDYDGNTKPKGAYVKDLNDLDNDLPVVNKAITDYFAKKIHPEQTIMMCDDLIEYQKVVKVSSKYSHAVMVREGEIEKVHIIYPKYRDCRYHDDDHWRCEYYGTWVGNPENCHKCNNFTPKQAIEYVKVEPDDEILEKLNDKTFRVFASSRPNDGTLKKVKTEGAKPEKFANTPEKCFIFNESVNGVKVPDYLDKQWYIDLAIKRLNDYGVTI